MAKFLPLIVQPHTLNGSDFILQNVVLGQITKENFGKLCFSSVKLSNFAHFFDKMGIILISQNWKKNHDRY
jgi:hypothetical protein